MKKNIKLIINAFKHLRKIFIHKYWVGLYCFKCGLYWRGLVHDLSKLSPTEFFESIKYYQGDSSPINAAKKDKGYSLAWMHHRGRNKHHYEYWTDNYDEGTTCIEMPFIYVVEMFCDYLGAARTYWGKKFTYTAEYKWWLNKSKTAKMHINTNKFITIVLKSMADYERLGRDPVDILNYTILFNIYQQILYKDANSTNVDKSGTSNSDVASNSDNNKDSESFSGNISLL